MLENEMRELVQRELKTAFRELLTAEMPAIISGVHAADKAVNDHPQTKQAVDAAIKQVAPSAAPATGTAAAAASVATTTAAAAAVANTATTSPAVQQAAATAAQTAVANAPPAKAA